ncbi:polymer-forming cytoskeletal protein [bacterium]|nr:polymer-forming cytoskeletal protein [bacterium]NUN45836.1 polymer-forming cytoskeletal protein [bacterium]HMV27057.1 polymer-forming cytoskeletal protein [bacterium]HMW33691.1 polymer-forming cytoskeletal protein [bacterium]HMW36132.1 polymer-forming cytoskeletal protein [bacterium]
MAFGEKNTNNTAGAGLNLISRGTVINGNISASTSIRIEGEIKGKIVCHDAVTIGTTGMVEGDIDAKSVIVGGKVIGNVTSQDRLMMESRSGIQGNIKARRLVVEEGAVFEGRCSMKDTKDKPLVINENANRDMFEEPEAARLAKAQ